MKIGIIVAMHKELELLLPLLQNSEESRMGGCEFHRGKVGRHDVIAMQCGTSPCSVESARSMPQ